MSWRPINFQGIIGLNHGIADQIDFYLQEKETRLANQIFNSLNSELQNQAIIRPSLPSGLGIHIKLSDAVEGLTKKIRSLSKEELQQSLGEKKEGLIKDLNKVLWEFTEVLEGCSIELFQQLKQVTIEKWEKSLLNAVKAIKDLLIHYIDDLIWVFKRLEGPLSEYSQKLGLKDSGWLSLFKSSELKLDSSILTHLTQSENYLKSRYDEFHQRYMEFAQLSVKVDEHIEKMKSYPILALMDIDDQNSYVDIYRLLKLKDLAPRSNSAFIKEISRALKFICSITKATKIFRIYYLELKDAFFRSSLELKSLEGIPEALEGVENLKVKIKNYRNEVIHLIMTIEKYRSFILETHPNPYISSRWGFSKNTTAPEPAKSKKLQHYIYRCEELNNWYEDFQKSLEEDPVSQTRRELHAHDEIDRILHEMNQPLISQSMIKNRAESLLEYIKELNEVGSIHGSTIEYVEEVFSKAMRADWKYNVLQEMPQFHELYVLHEGLEQPVDDPAHEYRIDRFCQLFDHIEDWVKSGNEFSHVNEIEPDVNDMKTYLQDFLATIQRAAKEKDADPFMEDTIKVFKRELMEYRYIFGQFFSRVTSQNSEGRQLRSQFLFVDQYFESIEILLNELLDAELNF